MKKILSIGNLFVKRIGLVAILLATIGVGDVWAKAKSTVTATANPSSGAGTAQVSKESSTSGFAASATQTTGGLFTLNDTHTYYLKATTTSAAWLWKGWYNNGVLAVSAQTSNIQVNGTRSTGGGSSYTYTATWLQPKVTGTTAGEDGGTNIKNYVFGPYTDPNVGSETRDVVFTLESNESGLIAKDGTVPTQHFTEALSGSWTANTFVKNSSDFPGIDQSSYTYNVTYKLSGVHGTNVTAKIKVASKYGSTNCTAQLMATEDYMPYFNYAYTEYNYTPDDPLAEGESLAQTFNVSKNCYAANNGVWSISLPADAAAKGFTLQTTADNPNATVQFEALPGMNKADLTTTLTAVCTYTDASGAKVTYTQTILLSGDAGKVITIDGAEVNTMTFDIDYAASGESTQTLPFETTLIDLTTTPSNLPAGDFITYTTWVAGLTEVSASVKHNLTPGQYTPSIKYSYNNDEVYSILNIVANIRLAQPVVTATNGLGQSIDLSWQTVYGATSYIVKSGETVVATIGDDEAIATTCRVTNIGGKSLMMGREYPFTVTAVYNTAEHFGTRISNEVKAVPTMYSELTSSTDFDLYTGTNAYVEGDEKYGKFPYSKPRKIDLTRAFDTSGMPLFDVLYIFGLTTNTSGGDEIDLPTSSVGCNAKTPLYVYRKSGDKYTYITEYNAVEDRFNHPSTVGKEESVNGRHLYFTGYCPFANIGVEADDEGWMYFVGGNTKVDIYLDDCTIIGRYRTVDGRTTGFKNKTVSLVASNFLGGENPNYLTGFSSVFVFESSSKDKNNPYKPTIHISGDNHLKGQIGYITSVVGNLLGIFDGIETGVGNVTTVSSPITIKPTSKGGYTDLTMDDLWPTKADYSTKEATNGFLLLNTQEVVGSEKVPCVDLGSKFGSLTINGGQYMLRNSAADGTYTCNMAFSYRKFTKEAEKMGVTALLSLYGFGGDQTDCRVVINGGTFNMYKNMYQNGTSYLGSNYYIDQENFLDLRLPAGDSESGRSSYINGGTFNGISHVVFCSQVTSSGRSPKAMFANLDLCLQDVIIEDPAVARQENGSVHFSIPTPFSDYYSVPKVEYNLSTGLEHVASESQLVYGGQSVNAYVKNIDGVDKTVVSLLLPIAACEGSGETCTDCELFEEAIYYNWVTAIPKFEINVEGQGVSVGGEAKVPTIYGTTIKYVVNQLLYTDLEGMENATMTGDIEVSFADQDYLRGQFTNPDNYRIYKNLNTLKVVEADRWYCFVAPYDIHEISVIETAETQLSQEQYKKNRTAAKALQAQNNLKMLYELSNFILPDPNGRATSLTLNELLCPGCLETPGLLRIPLYHYNGQKAADDNYGRPVMTANYYLYEITNSGFDKTTTTNAKDTFHIEWTPVSRAEGDPLMIQGQVYAIQFPWCPMCNDWEDRKDYDYWTGKLILFYGHGYDHPGTENDGQLIYGIDGQTDLTTAPGQGQAVYAGNYSFADMTAPSNAFVHDYDVDDPDNPGDWFIPAPSGHKVKPTEGFMLYNPGPASMPARISRSGQIEYDENVNTGLPTIAGRNSLMLFWAYDGIEVLALHEQLVTVYNLQGNIIFQQYMAEGEQVYVATGAGVFIVRGESETIKVMVE